MTRMLFPPYLNVGSKGAAVDWLHTLLFALGIGAIVGIERDNTYGPKTVEAVRCLQARLGFIAVSDIDGDFGPMTRKALKEQMGIDVDAIPGPGVWAIETRETLWVGSDGTAVWGRHED